MIYTSSYNSFNTDKYPKVSISGDSGKKVNYEGKYYSALAPKRSFWDVWYSNIDKIPEMENIRYYIEEYYLQVLANLDPEQVYHDLNNATLLCYEDHNEFCHRHIVAAWLEILLNIETPEVTIQDDKKVIVTKPSYIKEILEDVMYKNINDNKGFNSLRAIYLYQKAEKLERKAKELSTKMNSNLLKQTAEYYKYDAREAEKTHQEKKLNYYEKIALEMPPEERWEIIDSLSNKSCLNCCNDVCDIPTNEKVGLDEFGNPNGHDCVGWENDALVGYTKVLRKIK